MVKAMPAKFDKNRPIVAREIVETLPNWPFYIIVGNTSSLPVNIPINMKSARLGKAQSTIVSVQEHLQVYPVRAMPIYNRKKVRSDDLPRFGKWQKMAKKADEKREGSTQLHWKVRRLPAAARRHNVRISDDMELTLGPNIGDKAPYFIINGNGPNTHTYLSCKVPSKRLESNQVNKMVERNATEPATTKWVLSIVITLEKKSLLGICIED